MLSNKSLLLVVVALVTVCVTICQAAPSNSTVSTTKSPHSAEVKVPAHTRIQRSPTNKTVTTPAPNTKTPGHPIVQRSAVNKTSTTAAPHARSAVSPSVKSNGTSSHLSRPVRDTPEVKGNSSHVRSPSTVSLPVKLVSSQLKEEGSPNDSSSVAPLTRVPASKIGTSHESDEDEPVDHEAGSFVVVSQHPSEHASLSDNAASNHTHQSSPISSSGSIKPISSPSFVHHEDADHF